MLRQFGITLPPGTSPQLNNIAAVVIHATLPPFAKPGQQIDVTVSSLANAKSIRGGSLLMAPLKGIDGNIYAIAQGNVVVGGFGGAVYVNGFRLINEDGRYRKDDKELCVAAASVCCDVGSNLGEGLGVLLQMWIYKINGIEDS